MGHTNSTANLALPQFIGTDKPTWLGDVNGAFLAIDGYVGTNDAAVAAAASDASSAISQASAAVNTANTANTTAGNASTAANNAIGVANTANAIAGTVDAKVGLLADLNTTDRTSIVNAINETFDGSVRKIEKGSYTDFEIITIGKANGSGTSVVGHELLYELEDDAANVTVDALTLEYCYQADGTQANIGTTDVTVVSRNGRKYMALTLTGSFTANAMYTMYVKASITIA